MPLRLSMGCEKCPVCGAEVRCCEFTNEGFGAIRIQTNGYVGNCTDLNGSFYYEWDTTTEQFIPLEPDYPWEFELDAITVCGWVLKSKDYGGIYHYFLPSPVDITGSCCTDVQQHLMDYRGPVDDGCAGTDVLGVLTCQRNCNNNSDPPHEYVRVTVQNFLEPDCADLNGVWNFVKQVSGSDYGPAIPEYIPATNSYYPTTAGWRLEWDYQGGAGFRLKVTNDTYTFIAPTSAVCCDVAMNLTSGPSTCDPAVGTPNVILSCETFCTEPPLSIGNLHLGFPTSTMACNCLSNAYTFDAQGVDTATYEEDYINNGPSSWFVTYFYLQRLWRMSLTSDPTQYMYNATPGNPSIRPCCNVGAQATLNLRHTTAALGCDGWDTITALLACDGNVADCAPGWNCINDRITQTWTVQNFDPQVPSPPPLEPSCDCPGSWNGIEITMQMDPGCDLFSDDFVCVGVYTYNLRLFHIGTDGWTLVIDPQFIGRESVVYNNPGAYGGRDVDCVNETITLNYVPPVGASPTHDDCDWPGSITLVPTPVCPRDTRT